MCPRDKGYWDIDYSFRALSWSHRLHYTFKRGHHDLWTCYLLREESIRWHLDLGFILSSHIEGKPVRHCLHGISVGISSGHKKNVGFVPSYQFENVWRVGDEEEEQQTPPGDVLWRHFIPFFATPSIWRRHFGFHLWWENKFANQPWNTDWSTDSHTCGKLLQETFTAKPVSTIKWQNITLVETFSFYRSFDR